MKAILWDFDGVILNSNSVRDEGFSEVLKNYPGSEVEQLLDYHKRNGGLSRYVKFRYFFEEIRNEKVIEEKISELASDFSEIMLKKLVNKELIIQDSFNFIQQNHKKFDFHIVSGSDQNELRFLCEKLGLAPYFLSISGSPVHKNILVETVLKQYRYNKNECCLIGDSINDYEAAKKNDIGFIGYNSPFLKSKFPDLYLDSFQEEVP